MKQLKTICIISVILLLLWGIVSYAQPSRTIDFRGEIHGVVVSENGEVTLLAIDAYGGDFLFRIDEGSKLKNFDGEKISVNDLFKGAMVDINYRKYLFKKEDIHTVKTLKLYD